MEEPTELDPRDRPVSEGTHPIALLSAVTGIMGVVASSCLCLYPPIAPWLSGLFGLAAVGTAVFTLLRVRADAWHPSNRRQATWGLILGVVALLLATAALALFSAWGVDLGLGLGGAPPPP